MNTPVYIVADDHPLVLEGIKGVLQEMSPGCEIVDVFDYNSLLDVLGNDRDFDLIIADLNMPGLPPHDAIRSVQEKRPEIPILIVSATQTKHVIDKTMELGVAGYMFKSFPQDEMIKAIKTVQSGETFIPSQSALVNAPDPGFFNEGLNNFGAAALNQLPVGVIILNEKAKILFKNEAAQAILDQKDGVVEDVLHSFRASNPELSRHLHKMISDATNGHPDDREGGAISIDRPSMKRAFSLMFIPLPFQDNLQINQDTVGLFITDPEKPYEPPTRILARLYNLTDAEARLLQALIVGKKLERVASDFGVSLNTVRSHLKQIFRKTNTNRQSELVSLVMNSSAYMALQPHDEKS